MSRQDWHPTSEQLSAMLDNQLSDQEATQCQTHLETCQRCQEEQEALLQTVKLLHALPQAKLPRSFELPLDFQIEQIEPEPTNITTLPHNSQINTSKKAGRKNILRPIFRSLSACAAIIGFFFLLSALLPPLSHQFLATSSAPASNSSIEDTAASNEQAETSSAATTPSSTGEQNTTPTAITYSNEMQPQFKSGGEENSSYAAGEAEEPPWLPLLFIFNLGMPEGRLAFGLFLVLIGTTGFMILRNKQQIQ